MFRNYSRIDYNLSVQWLASKILLTVNNFENWVGNLTLIKRSMHVLNLLLLSKKTKKGNTWDRYVSDNLGGSFVNNRGKGPNLSISLYLQ